MRSRLTTRDRRALVGGAILIAGLVGLTRGVPAWRLWRTESQASAAELGAEVRRAEGAVAARRAMRDTLRARETRLVGLAPLLLTGDSPAAAGAALAGLVSEAAADAGVRLGAVQVRPDSAGPGVFTRVAIRADAVGDVHGLTQLLATLERGPTLLAVRELAITQPEPAAAPERPEALHLELVVEGLVHNAITRGR